MACFGNKKQKKQIKSGFFQAERFGSGKTLSELHIHYISPPTRVYDHAVCKEYCKDFTVALKMIDIFNRKQMYDGVIKAKENVSKDCNCIISMFLTSFNIYFVFGYACFMCICICFM